MDVLSDALRAVRLEGALFLNGEMRAPWCVNIPKGAEIARALKPGAQRMAICHLVLEGRCWVQVDGKEPAWLGAGEVVTLPQGDSHLLGSGPQYAAVDIAHMVSPRVPELVRVSYGGDGERTVIVCGWFAYEGDLPNPLTVHLPRMFVTALRSRAAGSWIEQSVNFVLEDAAGRRPGSDMVASKVAEVLFAEALRGYIESLPESHMGWLSSLRDPQLGRCLAMMHEDPARSWTVEALAREVHSSRSVLAERFTARVGMPPMQYLIRWRMVVAAGLLRNRQTSLAKVARDVGYESEAAFNRAFKREFGVPPGLWRQNGTAAVQVAP
jgi:AraC-like DNA-binding protein